MFLRRGTLVALLGAACGAAGAQEAAARNIYKILMCRKGGPGEPGLRCASSSQP